MALLNSEWAVKWQFNVWCSFFGLTEATREHSLLGLDHRAFIVIRIFQYGLMFKFLLNSDCIEMTTLCLVVLTEKSLRLVTMNCPCGIEERIKLLSFCRFYVRFLTADYVYLSHVVENAMQYLSFQFSWKDFLFNWTSAKVCIFNFINSFRTSARRI